MVMLVSIIYLTLHSFRCQGINAYAFNKSQPPAPIIYSFHHYETLVLQKDRVILLHFFKERRKLLLAHRFPPSLLSFFSSLSLLMASSSSNPPMTPDPMIAASDVSQNPPVQSPKSSGSAFADPSRFSPVPKDERDDFAFPLMDSWYDNGGNFPYIPNEAPPPPLNWEWMLRGKEIAVNQAWLPFFSKSLI
jgi:hypothetical protein